MRLLPFLALTGSALAQEGMMDKVTNWGGNLQRQLVNAFTNPIDSAAAAIAGAVVQPLNMQNWKSHLMPKDGQPEEWMVYMTGRNKTCYGRCDHSDRTWNQSVPLLTALPRGKHPLHLGTINCEDNEILCTSWSVGVPAIWHFIPNPTNPSLTDVRTIRFNSSTVSVENMTSIPSASTSRYLKYEPYEGMMQPIDGALQKYGMQLPFGMLIWVMGAVPSWLMMIVISFVSRQMMNRRMNEGPGGIPRQGAPVAGGAPPPAAAAGKASPAGKGAAGSKKKR